MNRKGFTLIELLVVVLIISVLAAIALPAYFRAVERSRISEVEILMGNVVQAQQRFKLRRGSGYAKNWKALDIAPAGVADGTALKTPEVTATKKNELGFCTKVTGTGAGACGNGFIVDLVGDDSKPGNKSGVVATRVGNNQYGKYQLGRYYDPRNDNYGEVRCKASGSAPGEGETASSARTNSEDLCVEFLNASVYGNDTDTPHVMPDGTDGSN